jgi:hypothetical protein
MADLADVTRWYNQLVDAVARGDMEARLERGLQLAYAAGADVRETRHQLEGMWLLASVEGDSNE